MHCISYRINGKDLIYNTYNDPTETVEILKLKGAEIIAVHYWMI